jgi:hypothetical protein
MRLIQRVLLSVRRTAYRPRRGNRLVGRRRDCAGTRRRRTWWAANRLLSVAAGSEALQVDLQLNDEDNTRDLAVSIAQTALQNLH